MKAIQISLAAARVNAGLTQNDVAEKINVSKQTIINWEKGRVTPGIPEIEMLSRIYEIPQDNIFLPCYSTKSRCQEKEVMKI
ncbi:MAG: helix-turn-helix transcriptional regulator [Lachnospiraceae bacterium]|nr:helix-turn-helix transcriptional regulator [Lachnospiraceae bacterium]